MSPPAPPLTHHDILILVAPFARCGRPVDLAASDRVARRLVFLPLLHEATDRLPALRETLTLEEPAAGRWRLTRQLQPADGPAARLVAEGVDAGGLLAAVDAHLPVTQFDVGPGWLAACSCRLAVGGRGLPKPVLTHGTAGFGTAGPAGALTLTLTAPSRRGAAGEVLLQTPGPDGAAVPEDLLAVLGWRWSRLSRRAAGHAGTLWLPWREPARSAAAAARLRQAADHLARTLAAPPGAFHRVHLRARWGVALRRGLPLLACLALVALAAIGMPLLLAGGHSLALMLAFNAPPLLLVALLCLPEMARIEMPPLPRPLSDVAWLAAADAPPAAR